MWLSHPVSFWIWNWKYLLTRFPLLSGFASHKALLNSFLYSNNGSFLSGAVLAFSFSMYYVSGLVWFGFFFTLFLLAHRLSHWTQDELLPKVFLLIVELGLFWPHTFFFYRRVFFLPYFFFSWTTQFTVLLTLEISAGLLLVVTLFYVSVFHMKRTKCPVSLKLLCCLVCITSKSEKLTCFGCSVLY